MFREMSKRGAFIVIEGVDRSGKTTQCRKLQEALLQNGIKNKLMHFPDRSTKTGQLIDEYLRDKSCKLNDETIHLLFTANRWENADKIKEYLNEGVSVIVDRYSYSGIVFSSVKKNMDINWCKQPESGLPKPDVTFLLTLSQEAMEKRPNFGEERYENTTFQKKVAELFTKILKENDDWKEIQADGSIEDVHSSLFNDTLKVIENLGNKPLTYFNFNKSNNKI